MSIVTRGLAVGSSITTFGLAGTSNLIVVDPLDNIIIDVRKTQWIDVGESIAARKESTQRYTIGFKSTHTWKIKHGTSNWIQPSVPTASWINRETQQNSWILEQKTANWINTNVSASWTQPTHSATWTLPAQQSTWMNITGRASWSKHDRDAAWIEQ